MPDLLGPIYTAHLLPEIEDKLLSLLRSLSPDDWNLPTIVPTWTVRNIVAHLLDTQLRKLSVVRDGFIIQPPKIQSNSDLLRYVNQLNADGVAFYSRLSVAVLISLMETVSRESCAFHQSLQPHAKAAFSVSWAGESESENWFDTARELTERWHHQQQIRLAVNQPGLMQRHLYHPVLDCFMRALPHSYRDVDAADGSLVEIEVSGDCGGRWLLLRDHTHWHLIDSRPEATPITVVVVVPQEIAWRVFTKGIGRSEAMAASIFSGDRKLGEHFFSTIAIIG